jgi:hypothetical protein
MSFGVRSSLSATTHATIWLWAKRSLEYSASLCAHVETQPSLLGLLRYPYLDEEYDN